MWKSFFLWTAKIQRRQQQQQPKAKIWTLTFCVRLYDILIHRHWLRFPTLCNTKFGSHNSIHEIERRKKKQRLYHTLHFIRTLASIARKDKERKHYNFRMRTFCRKFIVNLCVCSVFFWCSNSTYTLASNEYDNAPLHSVDFTPKHTAIVLLIHAAIELWCEFIWRHMVYFTMKYIVRSVPPHSKRLCILNVNSSLFDFASHSVYSMAHTHRTQTVQVTQHINTLAL